jgi:hypothetical protein
MIVIVIDQTPPDYLEPASADHDLPFSPSILLITKCIVGFETTLPVPSFQDQEELSTAFQNRKYRSCVGSFV